MYNYRLTNGLTNDYNWGGQAAMMILGFVFFVAIIYGIVALMRGARYNNQDQHSERVNPLDIAKERYAKGELSKSEFEQVKKDLSE